MIILHVANISNNPFNGVCIAVPAHINHQKQFADVALLNTMNLNLPIEGIDKQFVYSGKRWVDDVSEDFKNPDVVIFHEVYHIQYINISRDLRRMGISYIIFPHGCLVKAAQHTKRLKKIIANMFFFRKFIYGARAVQCLSENEYNNTLFDIPKFICSNGVDIPQLCKSNFHNDRIVISYIGRLQWYVKGIDLFVEAVGRLKDRLLELNACVNIYGPDKLGWKSDILHLITKNHVEELIHVHDAIANKEKAVVLLDTDIFIQTSRHEGMPMGILEAMSFGVPCLITEGTSLGTITKSYDAGWVADNNADSICEKLEIAINQRDTWKFKSQNAKNLVKDEFSWDKISYDAIKKYQQIVENK